MFEAPPQHYGLLLKLNTQNNLHKLNITHKLQSLQGKKCQVMTYPKLQSKKEPSEMEYH
jgi:hypothetical protein